MTRSHFLLSRSALAASLALLATTVAVAAPVLPAPAPTPAPSGSVAGPPDGLIAPPPPTQRPLPMPSIVVPAPTPAPAPRPAEPRPRAATPAPRPAARTPALQPVTTAPAPTAVQNAPATGALLPEAQPSTLPGMSSGSVPAPVPEATQPSALPEPADNGIPEWLPLAAIGGFAALIGGIWLWRRRKRPLALPAPEPEVAAAPPPPVSPRPAPVVPKPAAPATAPTPLGRRADLSVGFEALSAQSTLVNLRIRYAVTVRNSGTLDAEPVTVRIGLFAGSHVNPQGIAQWFTLDDEALHHAVDRVPAGGDYRFEGELAAPLDALNPITVGGRVLAIPLVAVDARYNHGEGQAPIDGQSARAFVIGREPQREGAKLAPFRLDQGPTSFAPLGQRDTGISKVA